MVDMPDRRKVHAKPIPRVGGVGIVFGALIPLLLWVPLNEVMLAYLFGALVLFGFGAWDDSHELGHYVKFIGQFIAVLGVVYYGDIHVQMFPFMNMEPLPEAIGKAFTVFAMVGMINAINHSDGLDGLAGGMSVLSLSCIAYLAFLADGGLAVTVAVAVLGGVIGFLRYNTHPASVFMGDSGSQFLGFTLGFLAVLLTQNINPALSPALPALILGLPIIDIIAVFAQRVYHGMNWFRATKNHIHHRLLELGFHHYEVVVIIYFIQMLFIAGAVFLRYESDLLILLLYLGTCILVFMFLIMAEKRDWRAHRRHSPSRFANWVEKVKKHRLLTSGTVQTVGIVMPLIFLGTAVLATDVPRDFGMTAGLLTVILLLMLIFGPKESIVFRAVSYVTAAFIVYLESKYVGSDRSGILYGVSVSMYGLLAIAIWLAVRYATTATEFRISPMDYLIIFIVLAVGIVARDHFKQDFLSLMMVKIVILFYGCELIFAKIRNKWNLFSASTLLTLAVLGVRSAI